MRPDVVDQLIADNPIHQWFIPNLENGIPAHAPANSRGREYTDAVAQWTGLLLDRHQPVPFEERAAEPARQHSESPGSGSGVNHPEPVPPRTGSTRPVRGCPHNGLFPPAGCPRHPGTDPIPEYAWRPQRRPLPRCQPDAACRAGSCIRTSTATCFCCPWLLGFFGLFLGPGLWSLFLSLTEYDVLSPPKFTGLGNYIRMFTDDDLFWPSLGTDLLLRPAFGADRGSGFAAPGRCC